MFRDLQQWQLPEHPDWLHQLLTVGGGQCHTLTNLVHFCHKTYSDGKTQVIVMATSTNLPWKEKRKKKREPKQGKWRKNKRNMMEKNSSLVLNRAALFTGLYASPVKQAHITSSRIHMIDSWLSIRIWVRKFHIEDRLTDIGCETPQWRDLEMNAQTSSITEVLTFHSGLWTLCFFFWK